MSQPSPDVQAVIGSLVGPGGPFEMVPAEVLGATVPVFAHAGGALHELLAESLQWADRDYLVTIDSRLTFGEHAVRVSSLAHALRTEHGVQPGDRVGITGANSPEWITAFWAAVSIGAVAVAYNSWWTTNELDHGLGHTRPKVVFADARRSAQVHDLATVHPDVVLLGLDTDLPEMATAYPQAPLPSADVAPDDPAVILYTSGTSGKPKGAVHSHRNVMSVVEYHRYNDALMAAFGDPTPASDRVYLLALPLFHIASLHNLVVPRLASGSTAVMTTGAFDVDQVLTLVERERVSNWGAVPTQAHRLLEHGDLDRYDTSSLRAFALASAPSSTAFKQRLRDGLPFASSLVDSYGLTESCTALAVATPMDLAESPGTLGRPIIGVELQVRDAAGNPVGPGVEGEICARSPYVMTGYFEDAAATARAIDGDRWLRTGDLGELDEQGRVRLSSRRSDLIIRGGENVYPAEVEDALSTHPDVAEVIVLGVPHESWGQEVGAVVVTRPGSTPTAEELQTFVAQKVAPFKVPTHWRVTAEALPRNATGKVNRAQVPLPA